MSQGRVPKTITAQATSGASRINHEYSYKGEFISSPLHHVYFTNVHRTALAVDGNDHCQGHRCLRGSDSNDEDGKNLPGQVAGVGRDLVKEREADHGDIDGIEHNLNTH